MNKCKNNKKIRMKLDENFLFLSSPLPVIRVSWIWVRVGEGFLSRGPLGWDMSVVRVSLMVIDTTVVFGWCRRKAAGGGRWVVGH